MNLYYRILLGKISILASLFITNLSVLASTKETSLLIENNNNYSYKSLVEQKQINTITQSNYLYKINKFNCNILILTPIKSVIHKYLQIFDFFLIN
ncbi:hypothetical protein [Okeania sp.]|uniref:hypothetical protein n=1 Tax=Okeania sp. TaxID=3100323 RepID=UPI002B4ADDC3|nr:hypothetical protein [Okeania sp.]MEB3340007.1 hypothetical protein [Okeania sp.]